MTVVEAAAVRTARRPGVVGLTIGAAVLSLVLIGSALALHAAGAPPVAWLLLTAAALAVRPLAVSVHRRGRRAGRP